MKKIFSTILLFVITFSSKAQSPIFDITDMNNRAQEIFGAYHKDNNNLLNQFEGTYVYNTGITTLKIVLQKKIMSSINGYVYEDLIVGEYQYIENNVEKINTLPRLNANYTNKRNHSIDSNLIIVQGDTGCDECLPNEKALYGSWVESTTKNTALVIIRKVIVNQVPAIRIFINWDLKYKKQNDPALINPSLAGGYYTLEKQITLPR